MRVHNSKKSHIGLRITACLLIAIIMLSFSLSVTAEDAPAVEMKENNVTHDIAIVFDHSQSMYYNTDRWSQALYAIGVFASMLDYDAGDKLGIYPMETISIGENGEEITGRLEITKDNIGDISQIYCKETSETIFMPAYTARDYLVKSNADEKWLIVMTDGEFYFDQDSKTEEREKHDSDWVRARFDDLLKDRAKKNVIYDKSFKRQYLGFGDAVSIPDDPQAGLYSTNVSDASYLAPALIDICNMIFQRNKVENIDNSGNFTINVSMKNIVAFAQGSNAAIQSLHDSGGHEMKKSIDKHVEAGNQGTLDQFRIPGERSADGSLVYDMSKPQYDCPVADVSGQVVTFPDCPAGTYTLNSTPGSDIELYYEPNVRIDATLTDEDGETVDVTKPVVPVKYKVNYQMIDAKTGENVSGTNELGEIDYHSTLTIDGDTKEIGQGEAVELREGSDVQLTVLADFLNKYQVEKVFDLDVKLPAPDEFKVRITGPKTLYTPDIDNWKPFTVEVTKNGKPLTDEELSALKSEFAFSDGNPAKATIKSDESAYEVEYAKNEDGSHAEEIQKGKVDLTATFTETDRFGREITGESHRSFKVSDWAPWVLPVLWVLAIAALIALIFFICTRKALPNNVVMNADSSGIYIGPNKQNRRPKDTIYTTKGLFKSTGEMTIDMPTIHLSESAASRCNLKLKLKAVDPIVKRSQERRIAVVEIISAKCDSIEFPQRTVEKGANGNFSLMREGENKLSRNDYAILEDSTLVLKKVVKITDSFSKNLKLEYKIQRL